MHENDITHTNPHDYDYPVAVTCGACGRTYAIDPVTEENLETVVTDNGRVLQQKCPHCHPTSTDYYFEAISNPFYVEGEKMFSHYEIQCMQEYESCGGETYFALPGDGEANVVDDPVYSLYGRLPDAGVEHICDRWNLDILYETLRRMGINRTTTQDQDPF